MGSAVLTALSLSIIAFQLSCSKTADAQTGGTTGIIQLGKIVYTDFDSSSNNSSSKIWIANYDGSNPTRITISLPNGDVVAPTDGGSSLSARLSPDGKTLFFTSYAGYIYSCGIDGSNLKRITTPLYSTIQSVN